MTVSAVVGSSASGPTCLMMPSSAYSPAFFNSRRLPSMVTRTSAFLARSVGIFWVTGLEEGPAIGFESSLRHPNADFKIADRRLSHEIGRSRWKIQKSGDFVGQLQT